MFAIAKNWEHADTTDEQRSPLRDLVKRLVGYPCKIACQPNNGAIDIVVFSIKKKRITDWLELQESGAIGVVFEQYETAGYPEPDRLDEQCEDYNDSLDVQFVSESESENEDGDKDKDKDKDGDKEINKVDDADTAQ